MEPIVVSIKDFFISYLAGKGVDHIFSLMKGSDNEKKEFILESKKKKYSEVQIDSVINEMENITETTARFRNVVELLTKSELSLSEISKLLNFENPDDILEYIIGERKVSFEIIDKMERIFNVNKKYLQNEAESPFLVKTDYSIKEVWNEALKIKAKAIYFILSDDEENCYSIVVQENQVKYIVIHGFWRLKVSEPPYTEYVELRNLYETYEVLDDLNKHSNEIKSFGKYLPSNDFNEIFGGYVYPKSILDKTDMSYWIDDFCDINHIRMNQYKENYGNHFINAQKEVKSFGEMYSK